jgi:peptide deformylase
MSVKKTSGIGSKVIRIRAKKVVKFGDQKLKKLIKDLTDTMRHDNLVGMAAPQIGQSWRVFVTEIRPTTYRKNISKEDGLRIFINPELVSCSDKQVSGYEGCGSVAAAQIFGLVKRPVKVTVKAFNEKGEKFTLSASGLLARVIQHEIDHLNGVVFIDHIKDTRKLLDRESYVKIKK